MTPRPRPVPSSLPVDTEAVSALHEGLETLDALRPGRDVDRRYYRRMIGARHNANGVKPFMLTRDTARDVQEVRKSEIFVENLEPDPEAIDQLLAVLRSRRSCRNFSDTPVPEDHIDLILEAGRWAPSAGNVQPWEFLVVTSAAARERIAEIVAEMIDSMRGLDDTFPGWANARYLASTPVLILPFGDIRCMAAYPYPLPERVRHNMFEQSIAMCIQNMWLMATRLGLTATNFTLGHPMVDRQIKEQFGVPEHFELPTLLALGHARHAPMPRPRRPLKEIVHRDVFDATRVRSDAELVDFFYEMGVRGRGFR